jgi:hypothetical protein
MAVRTIKFAYLATSLNGLKILLQFADPIAGCHVLRNCSSPVTAFVLMSHTPIRVSEIKDYLFI